MLCWLCGHLVVEVLDCCVAIFIACQIIHTCLITVLQVGGGGGRGKILCLSLPISFFFHCLLRSSSPNEIRMKSYTKVPFTLASKNRGFSKFANLRWKLLSNFLKTTKKPRQKNPPPEWGFLKLRVKLRELSECKWYA